MKLVRGMIAAREQVKNVSVFLLGKWPRSFKIRIALS